MTNFTKHLATFALAIALLFTLSPALQAQGTALTATTLSVAITSTSATTLTLTSATGVTVQGTQGNFVTVLYVGKELIGVKSLVSGTTYNVQRGLQGTRPLTYPALTPVLLGAPTGNFFSADYSAEQVPGASCTASQNPTLPLVYLKSGHMLDCLGSQWVLTNSMERPVVGSTVASPAGVMAATGNIFTVSGTNAITGITVPNGFASGMSLYLIPSGAFTTTTATNIGLASTGVVGKTLIMTWNALAGKWYPSY